MPLRILRESICTDLIIESLTPEEEVCLYRLKTAADDYGVFLGDLDAIIGHCFTKKRKYLSDDQVEGWLQGLAAKGAIRFYAAAGLRYLKILIWDQKPRNKTCKYPLPPGYLGDPTPHGSADLPADPATGMPTPGAHADDAERPAATGMPTPGAKQGAAPAASPAAQAPDKPLNWAKWYEKQFAVVPSQRDLAGFDKLQQAGVTDELIVHCIQLSIKEKAHRPLGMARSKIESAMPYGVRTLADWNRCEAEKQQPADLPTGSVDGGSDDPPPEEDDITRRLRQQRESGVVTRAG